jgi:hypothetical protein
MVKIPRLRRNFLFCPSLWPPPSPPFAGERGRVREVKLNIFIIEKLSSKNHSISDQAGKYATNIALLNKIYLMISCSLKRLPPWNWASSVYACG